MHGSLNHELTETGIAQAISQPQHLAATVQPYTPLHHIHTSGLSSQADGRSSAMPGRSTPPFGPRRHPAACQVHPRAG